MASPKPPNEKVPTYAEREAAGSKAKASKRSGYHQSKSRKPRHMRRRAPVRDSKRVYRGGFIKPKPLSHFRDFVKSENLPPAPALPLPQRVAKTPAEQAQFDVVEVNDSDSDTGVAGFDFNGPDAESADEDEEQEAEDEGEREEKQAKVTDETEVVDLASSDEESSDEAHTSCGPVAWPSDVVHIQHAEFPPEVNPFANRMLQ